MIKYGQVIEVHGRLLGGARVIDRFNNDVGELVTDVYECADQEELSSVLEALDITHCRYSLRSGAVGGDRASL